MRIKCAFSSSSTFLRRNVPRGLNLKNQRNKQGYFDDLDNELLRGETALKCRDAYGEDDKRKRVGDDRCPDCNGDGFEAGRVKPRCNRQSEKGVRCKMAARKSYPNRRPTAAPSTRGTLVVRIPKMTHLLWARRKKSELDLQTGGEHQPAAFPTQRRSPQWAGVRQYIETVRTDYDSTGQQSNGCGKPDATAKLRNADDNRHAACKFRKKQAEP